MNFKKLFGGLVLAMSVMACSSSSDRFPASNEDEKELTNANGPAMVGISGKNCGEDRGGGQAHLKKVGNLWQLQIRNSKCANVVQRQAFGLDIKTGGSGSQDRFADITFPRPGRYEIILASNKWESTNGREGMATYFNVTIVDEMPTLDIRDGRGEPTAVCGGYITANLGGGQVNIQHKNFDLSRCSTFDIQQDNGAPSNYPSKQLQGANGSYTISPKYYDAWSRRQGQENRIVVSFGREKVLVIFNAVLR